MEEFRGVWVATVGGLDWPTAASNSQTVKRNDLRAILDHYVEHNINAIVFQVRSECDSMFVSELEPWSRQLAPGSGVTPDPLWDPLQFLIEEAQRRGIEVHAWFNPYRAGVNRNATFSTSHISHPSHPDSDLVLQFDNYYWLDPGNPRMRELSLEVVMDVVRRYDVDAVHFDDYFYPYGITSGNPFPDGESFANFNPTGMTLGNWRRDNVNTFIQEVQQAIQREPGKEHVRFGLSPFGIWQPGHPPGISGLNSFTSIFADSRLWWREGWVDYMTPQIYWFRAADGENPQQDFDSLLTWWADPAQNVHDRHLWPGLPTYKLVTQDFPAQAIVNQITSIRSEPGANGNIQFRSGNLTSNSGNGVKNVSLLLRNGHYAAPSLIPPTTWIDDVPPQAPEVGFTGSGPYTVNWTAPPDQYANWWLLQRRAGSTWTNEVLPGWRRTAQVPAATEEVRLRALDRLANVGDAATLSLSVPTPPPAPPIESTTVQNMEAGNPGSLFFFRAPSFSASTTGILGGSTSIATQTDANNRLDPAAGNPGGVSVRSRWEWNTSAANNFIRLTTFGTDAAANVNPVIDRNQGLGFYVKLPEGSLDLAVMVRETSSTGPIGSNGGADGPIDRSDYIRVRGSANWQYVYFDLPELGWTSFAGDGPVEGDWGVLESLAIRRVEDEPVNAYSLYIDDIHQGPPHTPFGPPAMPQGFVAEPGEQPGTARLSWEANNREENLAGYHVYRMRATQLPVQPLPNVPIHPRLRVAVLDADTHEWIDRAVIGGAAYFYQVAAANERTAISVPTPTQAVLVEETSTSTGAAFAAPGSLVVLDFTDFTGNGLRPGGGEGALDSRTFRVENTSAGDVDWGNQGTEGPFARGLTTSPPVDGGLYRVTVGGVPHLGIRPSHFDLHEGVVTARVMNGTGGPVDSVTVSTNLCSRNSGNRSDTLDVLAGTEGDMQVRHTRTTPMRRTATNNWAQEPVSFTVAFDEPLAPGAPFLLSFRHTPAGGAGDHDEFAIANITLTAEGEGGPAPSDIWMLSE